MAKNSAKKDASERLPLASTAFVTNMPANFNPLADVLIPKAQKAGILDIPGVKHHEEGYYSIPLNLIEEDPENPRRPEDFNPETIKELAANIVKLNQITPIQVRPHPEKPGYFIITNGARRFRAMTSLGKKSIRATLDATKKESDLAKLHKQVADNMQREDLSPAAILNYITVCLANGMKKGEIAEMQGKPETFIKHHAAVIDAKNPLIRAAYEAGKIPSPRVAYELARLSKKDKDGDEAVTLLLTDIGDREITQADIDRLTGKHEPEAATPTASNQATREIADPIIPYSTATISEENDSHGTEGTGSEDTRTPPEYDSEKGIEAAEPDASQEPRRPKQLFYTMYKDEEVILTTEQSSGKSKVIIKIPETGEKKEVPVKELGAIIRYWHE